MSDEKGSGGTMRALRVNVGSKHETLETIPIPEVGPEDVLVKVKAAGLAPGPFTLTRNGGLAGLPVTLGHEAAGVVEAVGSLVPAAVKPGQRVRIHSSVGCRECAYCLSNRDQMCDEAGLMGFHRFAKGEAPIADRYRDGGLAEYIRAPYWLVDELPEHVSFEVGAKLHELATALSTIEKAELRPGSTVIITAPTGAVGTSMIKLAPFFGIHRLVLVGRSTDRLEAVRKLADPSVQIDIVATDKLSADWEDKKELARTIGMLLPKGADAYLDLVGSGTGMWQVFAGLKTNGVFVHLGANWSVLPVPMGVIMQRCWKIVGTRNHSRSDAKKIISWLAEKRLTMDELITHRWPLEEIDQAVNQLQQRTEPMWMGVVTF